ncbi:glycosyltransferase family 39 protein [Thamnocephalis sphaerospora]|uniref:Dolichyl-phosphate-mannose--protein mannosyltransferase n=1 Tax=Thamnocephalis sphaerospora TaxID=78915 RepID=A0A4V1IXI4_9FUNG|nr:glycosyltransferase family 39 protein [Thamnocephalis sphaerospora]|eukprot:RKP11169.1 glycosyltransferase family 39 protein [Thamnocephalis sphaerospora]
MTDAPALAKTQPAAVGQRPATARPKVKASVTGLNSRDYTALAVVTLLAFVTRFYKLSTPDEVVFDEVHFGKFASYYLRRTFFFDVHPPLGKMLLAGVGWLVGYGGEFLFDNIGDSYITNNVPYLAYRGFTAGCGALVVPFAFAIMRESGYAFLTSILVAAMLIFDNALITQSRLILLDSMLMLFMIASIYSYVRFYKLRGAEFTAAWWFWMCATGVALGLTTSVKMVGLFAVALVGICVIWDLWIKLDYRNGLTMRQWSRHFFARAIGLIYVPLFVYLISFYIHFAVLNKSGPGDDFMSTAFQRTLEGSSVLTKSVDIINGDIITMQNRDNNGYLHSHPHTYPMRYKDNRISSQGQQVTAYQFDDENNHWRVPPGRLLPRKIYNNELVHLVHIMTGTILRTHDVASPLTTTNTEITTIDMNNPANARHLYEAVFRIEISGGSNGDDGTQGTVWQTQNSSFKLIQAPLNVALYSGPAKLPEWGFGQNEVNGEKDHGKGGLIWTARQILGREAKSSATRGPEDIPFMRKFFELQSAMLIHNAGLTETHPYQSPPGTWPLVLRGISFWTKSDRQFQIYLLANPFGWWLCGIIVLTFPVVLGADLFARQRGYEAIDKNVRRRIYRSAGYLFLGWLLHYIPFFLMGRSLFLHHYLPACILAYMVAGTIFQFACIDGIEGPLTKFQSVAAPAASSAPNGSKPGTLAIIVAALTVIGQVVTFVYFAPMTYGDVELTTEEWNARRWLPGWNFHYAK